MEALRQLKIDLGIDDEDDALNGEMLGFHSSDRQLKPKAQWQNGHYVSSIENSLESPSFVVNAGSSLHNRPPVLDISPRIVAHAENRTTLENSAVSELKESLADVSYDDKVVHSSRSNSLAPASGSTNKSVLNGTYNKEPQIFDASSEEDLPYFEEMKKDTSIS